MVCDNQKINDLVSYKPLVSIDEGLRKTIDWLLIPGNLEKYKADICKTDIESDPQRLEIFKDIQEKEERMRMADVGEKYEDLNENGQWKWFGHQFTVQIPK